MRLSETEIDQLRGSATVHRNTAVRDEVVFLRTSAQAGGQYTLAHATAEPGGGVLPHYHRTYDESFEVLEGVLTVEVAGRVQVLQVGEVATAPRGAVHRWANQSSAPVRFLIEVVPGHEGFEKGLQIIYGLATDGRSTPGGVPRNVLHTAVLMELTDMWLPRVSRPLQPLIHVLANRARAQGVDQQLMQQYCR